MLFYGIAFAVIIVCAAGIVAVAARKFPQLTLIDAEALPAEREAAKKKAIIRERVSRRTSELGRRIAAALTRRFERFQNSFREAYRKALALERQFRQERRLDPEQAKAKAAALLAEADAMAKGPEPGAAEKKYIEVIALDEKNPDAYRGLARLYGALRRHSQAKETFEFLIKMTKKARGCRHDSKGMASRGCDAPGPVHTEVAGLESELGQAALTLGDVPAARAAFERAVALEPANPRRLDLLLDACILEGDKARARAVFEQFKAANPENAKLASLDERIAAMPEPVPPEPKRQKVFRGRT